METLTLSSVEDSSVFFFFFFNGRSRFENFPIYYKFLCFFYYLKVLKNLIFVINKLLKVFYFLSFNFKIDCKLS